MSKPPKSPRAAPPPPRPRGGRARAVSELVPDIGRAVFRRFGFIQSAVVSRWGEIVGVRYAGVSSPESIRFPVGQRSGGVLTLCVQGAHAPMVQHVTPAIIERVNRFFGYDAVARIVIRQGAVPIREVRVPRKLDDHIPVPLSESLSTIGDPELRAVLEALARGVAAATSIPIAGKIS